MPFKELTFLVPKKKENSSYKPKGKQTALNMGRDDVFESLENTKLIIGFNGTFYCEDCHEEATSCECDDSELVNLRKKFFNGGYV